MVVVAVLEFKGSHNRKFCRKKWRLPSSFYIQFSDIYLHTMLACMEWYPPIKLGLRIAYPQVRFKADYDDLPHIALRLFLVKHFTTTLKRPLHLYNSIFPKCSANDHIQTLVLIDCVHPSTIASGSSMRNVMIVLKVQEEARTSLHGDRTVSPEIGDNVG